MNRGIAALGAVRYRNIKGKSTTCSSFSKKPRKFTTPSLLSTTYQESSHLHFFFQQQTIQWLDSPSRSFSLRLWDLCVQLLSILLVTSSLFVKLIPLVPASRMELSSLLFASSLSVPSRLIVTSSLLVARSALGGAILFVHPQTNPERVVLSGAILFVKKHHTTKRLVLLCWLHNMYVCR